jgi:3-oxoacyl-[acyl-carrier protein] reductase
MTSSPSKTAIITGASRGIGRAVASRLARDGFAVVVHSAGSTAKAEGVVNEITSAGGQAIAVQADVANAASVERLFKETLATFGRIDVVVNCAGIIPLLSIADGDLEVFDKVIAINLRGNFVVLGQAARHVSAGGRREGQSYGSTTGGARRSSGSRKANRRRPGHGCRVIGSALMKCAYS